MAAADYQAHAAQIPAHEAAQELGPERLGFAGADLHAQHLALAVGVDAHGHYHRHADDAPGLARLDVGGVDPQVRPVAFERTIEEGVHALVELGAQA